MSAARWLDPGAARLPEPFWLQGEVREARSGVSAHCMWWRWSCFAKKLVSAPWRPGEWRHIGGGHTGPRPRGRGWPWAPPYPGGLPRWHSLASAHGQRLWEGNPFAVQTLGGDQGTGTRGGCIRSALFPLRPVGQAPGRAGLAYRVNRDYLTDKVWGAQTVTWGCRLLAPMRGTMCRDKWEQRNRGGGGGDPGQISISPLTHRVRSLTWTTRLLSCSVMFDSWRSPWTVTHQAPIRGILQARILEWTAISFSRGSSWPRNQTHISCLAGRFFPVWATWSLSKI